MTVSAADIKALFPELSSISDPVLELHITIAIEQVDSSCWGNLTDTGIKYLAAHSAIMGSPGTKGKEVTSVKVGDLQKSFASGSSKSDIKSSLAGTKYGLEYKRLMGLCGPSITIAVPVI